MLGAKKTAPLWRQSKPKFLEQDKAKKMKSERSASERGIIEQQITARRLEHAKAASHSARHRF